jgi:hypothetical protein
MARSIRAPSALPDTAKRRFLSQRSPTMRLHKTIFIWISLSSLNRLKSLHANHEYHLTTSNISINTDSYVITTLIH